MAYAERAGSPLFRPRPTCLAAWLLAVAPAAWSPGVHALPQGAVPTNGQATVRQTSATELLIQQTTAKAGLDWSSFSIAAGERVQVQQPSAASVLLNRVVGDNPSAIHGALSSNGSVWLINPRGIVFGAQSRVDVGSLVASTLPLAMEDAITGQLRLRTASTTETPGALLAEGQMSAPGGTVVLVAPQLTQRGSINARRVGLAAGSDVLVDLEGDGLVFLNVRNDRLDTALNQLGRLQADGGSVDLRAAARAGFAGTVLNLEGVVQARSLGQLQGRIAVDGGDSGITRVAGTLDATAGAAAPTASPPATAQGGDVLVQGRYIAIENTARLDASGAGGGGSVRVGGDFQGRNLAVRNAERVAVLPGAELSADGLVNGDGGTVIVWADHSTRFLGSANARGGAIGGNGGLVEVSGKAVLDYRGQSDRSAPRGRAGTLLLDPENLTVGTVADLGGDNSGRDLTSRDLLMNDESGVQSSITANAVTALLSQGPVQLEARLNIEVTAPINQTADGSNLTLRAGNNILVSAPITVGGTLSLSARDNIASPFTPGTPVVNEGFVQVTAPLTAGSVTITNNGYGFGTHQLGADITTNTLSISGGTASAGGSALTADSIWTVRGASSVSGGLSGSSALTKAGPGVLTLNNGASYTGSTRVTEGGLNLQGPLASSVVDVTGGTLTAAVSGALASTAAVSVASGASLALGASSTVTTLALNGSLTGGSSNLLTTTGNTALAGATVAAALTAGTLSSTGNSTLLAPVTVVGTSSVDGGSLSIGDGGTVGSLAAPGINVTATASLVHNRSDAVTLGADFIASGDGLFQQSGSGNLLLGGGAQQLATARIAVGGGGLTLQSGQANRIADTSAVAVTGSTLTANQAAETTGPLSLSAATVDGSGALQTGALTSTGATRIATTLNATSIDVSAGTLTLGNGSVSGLVSSSGSFTLGSTSQLVFEGATGSNNSLGDVAGSGSIVQRSASGHVLNLNGSAPAISSLTVSSGTVQLANGALNRINDSAPVTVASGARLGTGNTAETVASLALAGTLSGSGALTAASTTLQAGSVVSGALGPGALVVEGSSSVSGTAASGSVSINSSGHLSLASAQRLTAMPSVNFAAGGRLTLVADQNVGAVSGSIAADGGGRLLAQSVTLNNSSLTSALVTDTLVSDGASSVRANVTVNTGTSVNSGTLTVGDGATAGALAGAGPVTLAGNTTLQYNRSDTVVANTVAGTGTVRQAGSGELQVTGTIAATAVQVNSGTLSLAAGNNNRLADSAALQVASGATLTLNNSSETVATLTTAGQVNGVGTLSAGSYTLQAGASVSAGLGAGTLSVTGNSSLSGPSAAQTVQVQAGTLTLGTAQRLLGSAQLRVDSGAALQLNGNQSVALFTHSGTLLSTQAPDTLQATEYRLQEGAAVAARLGTGTVNVLGNSTLSAPSAAGVVNVSGGTLALGAAELLANTAAVTINAGAGLALGGTETVASLASSGTLGGPAHTLAAGTVVLNAGADVTAQLNSNTLVVNGSSRLQGTASAGTVSINSGTFTTAGDQRLASTAAVTVAGSAEWALGGDQTLAALNLAGSLRGSRTVTAATTTLNGGALVQANLGTGALVVAGDSSLQGRSAATSVAVNGGATLNLNGDERFTAAPALALDANGRLVLAGDQTLGTLAGTGQVELGAATLRSGLGGSSSFGGSISGSGSVEKQGVGNSLTFTAAQAYTGRTAVSQGSLVLNGNNLLAAASTLDVAPGATVTLGGPQAVAALNLAGTLGGTGVLTAANYLLNSGQTQAGAALGAGAFSSSGNSQLGGTAAAGTVNVASGTLNLNAAGRLTGTPVVTVPTGSTLTLAGAERVASLALAGTLNGTGQTLTADTSTLASGAMVNADLGGAVVNVAGNSQLGGRITAANLAINAGTLSVVATADRIADTTAVTVAAGARLLLAGAETVGAFTLAGTLASSPDGAHRLTAGAGSTLQAGAQVLAPLGGASLRVSGNSLLAAAADATTVAIDAGQLTLAGAERLNDAAAVTVARIATLALDSTERVGSLTLAGALQGSGTLSATRYTLEGGTVVAHLGSGSLASTGSSRLQGLSAADDVQVDSGTLTLAGTQRLTATPAVTLAGPARLELQGDQTLRALAGSGALDMATGNLQVGAGQAAGASSSFAGTLAGSGNLVKVGDGSLNFSGTGNHSGSTQVQGGTLQLSGTLAGSDIQVAGGARLALTAAERLADTATVAVARNGTLSLTGIETVAQLNLQGRLDGSGSLRASDVALDGASVAADLAAARISSRGASSLSGVATAGTVRVLEGSLALASAGRLGTSTAVTVDPSAALQLGGNTNVDSLALAGTLTNLPDSAATLTARDVLLQGGSTSAELGAGSLRSTGSSTLGARTLATTVAVEGGTLNVTTAQAFSAAPAATVAAGATLQLSATQTLGSLAGRGDVALGSFTLATGAAGNSSFAGRLQGSGNLVKAGPGEFTLTGNNGYTGTTTVQAGTLTVGDGATGGSLASGTLVVEGTLKLQRSDGVTLAQAISGSGALEQAGSGRLTMAGSNKTYGGATRVSAGELATANAEALPDNSAVQVAAGAALVLAGAETVRSVSADGRTTLGGALTATEDLLFNGPVLAANNAALQLTARRIDAQHADNRWGPLSLAAQDRLTISAGSAGSSSSNSTNGTGANATALRALELVNVDAGNGGNIEAGVLTLSGTTTVSRGTLNLVASGALQAGTPAANAVPIWDGKLALALPVAPAAAVVQQTAGRLDVAAGAQLNVQATQGGSVLLAQDNNRFVGGLQVLSGPAFGTPWAVRAQQAVLPGKGEQTAAVQSLVQVHAGTLNVGGRGIEADVVSLRATSLATPASLATPGATSAPSNSTLPTIVARLPFDNSVGTAQSLPALTLWLNDGAFALTNPFGSNNGGELRIDVGSRALGGGRDVALDAGYINVLPRGRGQGSTSVQLVGPPASANGYRFFFDGAGVQGEIPVFYNGVLPVTPQVENSISATVSVSEGARRERFEEAVRTENVAVRLRAGVIAEVGPGRPATQGAQGARPPQNCPPAAGSLRCEGPAR